VSKYDAKLLELNRSGLKPTQIAATLCQEKGVDKAW
jgi:hypothetical protein